MVVANVNQLSLCYPLNSRDRVISQTPSQACQASEKAAPSARAKEGESQQVQSPVPHVPFPLTASFPAERTHPKTLAKMGIRVRGMLRLERDGRLDRGSLSGRDGELLLT